MMSMQTEVDTNHAPKRAPARSFADLQSGAPAKPPVAAAIDAGLASLPSTMREDIEAHGEAPMSDTQKLDMLDTIVGRLIQKNDTRFDLLEQRVAKLDTILESLEDVVDRNTKNAQDTETPSATVRHLVQLAAVDGMLSPVAALLAIARELKLNPSALRESMSTASGKALQHAGIEIVSAPRPAERRAPRARKKSPKTAAKKASIAPQKMAPAPAVGKAPPLTQANLRSHGITQGMLAKEARLSEMTTGRFLRGGGEGSAPATRTALLEAWRRLVAGAK